MNFDHNNAFRMNHVGLLPRANKRFVIDDPKSEVFQVYEFCCKNEDLFFAPACEGKLKSQKSELPGEWHGDFSKVIKPGNYKIECGGKRSRLFAVHDNIYAIPARVIFNFFTWQRCGHKLGWAGACHRDDGVIRETGAPKDFSGGHHQSCDLRKSIDGISIGIIGLIKYALQESPHWDDGGIADEIRWSCDYFHKLVHPEGFMRDGLFEPTEATLDAWWKGRFYYNRPAAASEQWHSIRLQALAARYFRSRGDHVYADKCLRDALQVWNYMISDQRDPNAYRAPGTPPLGLRRINEFYAQVYLNSAADWSFRLCAAADLFRATNKTGFIEEVASCVNKFCALQLSDESVAENPAAACFREATGKTNLAGNSCLYGWNTVGPLSLCEALELIPEHPDAGKWRDCLEKVARQHSLIASRNVWQKLPECWVAENDLTASWLTWRQIKKENLHPCGYFPEKDKKFPCYYIYGERTGLIVSQALFLLKASQILNEPEYLGLAQRQTDWVLGANPYDASCVTGVGYNQLPLPMWALSPPIPQIPGGVSCGLSRTEYDIPVAGQFILLLSEIKRATQTI